MKTNTNCDLILAACAKLDSLRFASDTDRILARIGDEGDVEAFYGDSDGFEAAGIDVVALAGLMPRRLSAKRLGVWLNLGLDINVAVKAINHGLTATAISKLVVSFGNIDEVNGAIANFVDAKEDDAKFATVEDKILARLGLD